jgi:DNA topoisomerase VI subunit A
MAKIYSLQHENVDVAKSIVEQQLNDGAIESVPRLSTNIIQNRWRAYQKSVDSKVILDANTKKFVIAALEVIVKSATEMDQRDIYYGIRGKHPDWKISGHQLDTAKAYDTFVGTIMEKVQLVTGFTMQSLGVRAGPRGIVIGDDESYFLLPDGKRNIKVNITAPVGVPIKFNIVDEGVQFITSCNKIIHYEKAAGMDSLLVSDMPKMIEGVFMTSQGYNVEAATKLHRDMENRGLKLCVLGDADPHGYTIQHMYGRASKSNAYMPDCFYPRNATILGLSPRMAKELGLPPEKINSEHAKILANLRKLIEETHPENIEDIEIFENEMKKWEWQALKGLDEFGPAIYMIESLRANNVTIKYVPEAETLKNGIIKVWKDERLKMVEKEINRLATELVEPLKNKIKQELRETFSDVIESFNEQCENEAKRLTEEVDAVNFREAVKQKLIDRPAQYYSDAARKLISEMDEKASFDLIATIDANIIVENPEYSFETSVVDPKTPERELTVDDLADSIGKRVTGKRSLIEKIRTAFEKTVKKPINLKW